MATRTVITDDLDGSEPAVPVVFSLDRKNYVIDLSEVNAEELREILRPYIAAGRKEGR